MSSSSARPARVSLVITLCFLIAGAALGAWANVYRLTSWTRVAVVEPGATNFVLRTPGARHQRIGGTHALLTVELPDWRPLDLHVDVRVPEAAGDGVELQGDATGGTPVRTRAGANWTRLRLPLATRPPGGRETLVTLDVDPSRAARIEIGAVDAQPVMTWRARLWHGGLGAIIGILLALLCHPRNWRWMSASDAASDTASDTAPGEAALPRASDLAPASSAPSQAPHAHPRAIASPSPPRDATRTLAAIGVLIFLWFALWTLVKPILQAPDEPHHLMRAEAIARTPWIARDLTIEPDPRRVNALAYDIPDPLWKIIPRATAPLTAADLAAFARTPWGQDGSDVAVQPFRIALASYPTLYYWSAFALAEPIIRGGSLSPYAAIWTYRLATACLSALLWVAVFVQLRRLPETRALAPTLLVGLLLVPMVGYVSGAVHTDGPSIALAILAYLLAWRTLRTGDAAVATCLVLLAGLFVKPSGVPVAGSIAIGAGAVWLAGRSLRSPTHEMGRVVGSRARDTARLLLAVAIAGGVAYAAFYAWSPPVVFGESSRVVAVTPLRYLTDLGGRAAWLWTSTWGMLGWVDVRLAGPWYALLIPLWIANAACAWWRPATPVMAPVAARAGAPAVAPTSEPAGGRVSAFTLFCLSASAAFIAATFAGEYGYAAIGGYFIQGRYFLPALIGLVPLLNHRVPALRGATLVYLGVMSLLLMRLNVVRCFADWPAFWQSLPFVS